MKRFDVLLLSLSCLLPLSGQPNPPNRLVQFADKGDLAHVKSLLSSGADPNAVDNSQIRGWTALMAAARAGSVTITKALIRAHADVNATNQYDASALDVAELTGHTEVASIIRAAGGRGRPKKPEIQPRVVRGGGDSLAFLRTAIQEPRIKSLFPGLECFADIAGTYHNYGIAMGLRDASAGTPVGGETVTIRLQQGGLTLAESSWSTVFPDTLRSSDSVKPIVTFLAAKVSSEDLLVKLLHASVFMADDLADLAQSHVPEVRVGAAANLTDQSLLARLAIKDVDPRVRETAVKNLTDQAMLVKVATEDADLGVRGAAVKNLTDQGALAKVVIAYNDSSVRSAAAKKLSDQVTLAALAISDQDIDVRIAAVERLTNQAALVQLATDTNWKSRDAAVTNLTDQDLLVRMAKDKNTTVVFHAISRLASIQKNQR